ncbi:MAG: hypothetical protein ABSH21_08850 [Verrucomicrobiia bacterium]|jgi:hypothetical protein
MTSEEKLWPVSRFVGDVSGFGSQETQEAYRKLSEEIRKHNEEVAAHFANLEIAKKGNVSAADAAAFGKRLVEQGFSLPARGAELAEQKIGVVEAARKDLSVWHARKSEELRKAEAAAEKALTAAGLKKGEAPMLFEEAVRHLTRGELEQVGWLPLLFVSDNPTQLKMEANEKREALARALTQR